MLTSDRAFTRVVSRADGEPLTEELVGILRERVRMRYYDRSDVIDATARAIALRGEAAG